MITTEVENFPGFPEGIAGPELMDKLFSQAKRFGATIIQEYATSFGSLTEQSPGPFKLKIGQEEYTAQTIILANGASARWLNAPGEERLRNRGISACATCDGPLPVFRNKPIMVVGGGDSACEEALFLTRFASKVMLVHRRDQLRASKIMAQRVLEHPKIEVCCNVTFSEIDCCYISYLQMMWNTTIVQYEGEDKLEAVMVKNSVTGEETRVVAAGLFMAIGHEPNTKELLGTGLELDEENYISVEKNVYTNIEGVFAAGDCHDRMYRQAITASGFGCMAAITAERWLEARGE